MVTSNDADEIAVVAAAVRFAASLIARPFYGVLDLYSNARQRNDRSEAVCVLQQARALVLNDEALAAAVADMDTVVEVRISRAVGPGEAVREKDPEQSGSVRIFVRALRVEDKKAIVRCTISKVRYKGKVWDVIQTDDDAAVAWSWTLVSEICQLSRVETWVGGDAEAEFEEETTPSVRHRMGCIQKVINIIRETEVSLRQAYSPDEPTPSSEASRIIYEHQLALAGAGYLRVA